MCLDNMTKAVQMNVECMDCLTGMEETMLKEKVKRVLAGCLAGIMVLAMGVPVQAEEPVAESQEKIITGFGQDVITLETEKGTLEEVISMLPQTMEVYLEDGTQETVNVGWSCLDDYENTEYDLYTFDMSVPDGYMLGDGVYLPYAEVKMILDTGESGTGEEDIQTRELYPENPNSSVTLDTWLGASNILAWLESHENNGYYLGTPYTDATFASQSPDYFLTANGEAGGNGHMNCTGFVANVLRNCGADLSKIGTRMPGHYANATNWNDTVYNNGIKSYRFNTIQEALNSGILQKGDILYFEPNTWSEPDADCHIGFFWGNTSSENRFWHSATHPSSGNQISEIVAKTADSSVYVFPVQHTGKVVLQKSSSETSITDGNGCYSLEGAEYGVYSDQACRNKVADLRTGADGKTNTVELNVGTYYVKETKAPEGYYLDEQVYTVTVAANQTATVNVRDIPGNDPAAIILNKIDKETGLTVAQGGASLDGAQFTINYYDGYYTEDNLPDEPTRSWVIETQAITNPQTGEVRYRAMLNNDCKVSGDDFYYVSGNTDAVIPLGTITVEETQAPEGYLLEESWLQPAGSDERIEGKYVSQITMDNNMVSLQGGNEYTLSEQIKRGDIEGVKIAESSHERMADVPFKITSVTTGESHTIVTDENGYFSTSADWVPHTTNTNNGISAEDGIWFGTSKPDDTKGALPYDTYLIEEQRCDANEGYKLLSFEIIVSRDNYTVDLGTLTDEYEQEISIHTTATGEDGEKSIIASDSVTIVDTVTLTGLTVGHDYRISGWQMIKEENAELIIDGQKVEGEYEFTAEEESMEVEVVFTFDASELAGKNLVTFEELFDVTNPDEPEKVAEHKDIDDEGQTILITKKDISIHTNASGEDGKKTIDAKDNVTIVDTVTLSGLTVGTEYRITGWQMIKEENAELVIDGKRVENDYVFTAEKEDMEVEIRFTFNASDLSGKHLVTYEELYDMSNPDEPEKVAEHKDINDAGQTVVVRGSGKITTSTPGGSSRSGSVRTGDTARPALYVLLALAAVAAMVITGIYRQKKAQAVSGGVDEANHEKEIN